MAWVCRNMTRAGLRDTEEQKPIYQMIHEH